MTTKHPQTPPQEKKDPLAPDPNEPQTVDRMFDPDRHLSGLPKSGSTTPVPKSIPAPPEPTPDPSEGTLLPGADTLDHPPDPEDLERCKDDS